ncbi:hypothetical protein TNCV_1305741 [Trichonephila clavipes]|nr:hypothetical protein TNCV_1305741 [Trichonephila clavipes]
MLRLPSYIEKWGPQIQFRTVVAMGGPTWIAFAALCVSAGKTSYTVGGSCSTLTDSSVCFATGDSSVFYCLHLMLKNWTGITIKFGRTLQH